MNTQPTLAMWAAPGLGPQNLQRLFMGLGARMDLSLQGAPPHPTSLALSTPTRLVDSSTPGDSL